MQNLYKILALRNKRKNKYFQNPIYYGKKIRQVALKLLPDARVLVFGSVVKGEYHVGSDFDILVITNKKFEDSFAQAQIKVEILKHFPDNLFEIHLVNKQQFGDWYSRFIKKDYIEV